MLVNGMIEVVAGLIRCNDKYIIAKRTYGDAPAIGKWEFPGGKIEDGETEEEAMIREAKEELGIDVEVVRYLTDYIQVYETRTIHLKLYYCVNKSKVININSEHTEYSLVNFEDIRNYDLAPADNELYNHIKDNYVI